MSGRGDGEGWLDGPLEDDGRDADLEGDLDVVRDVECDRSGGNNANNEGMSPECA